MKLSHEQRRFLRTLQLKGIEPVRLTKMESLWAKCVCFSVDGFYNHGTVELVTDDKCLFIAYTRHSEEYDIKSVDDLISVYLKCKDYVYKPSYIEEKWENLVSSTNEKDRRRNK